MALNQLQAVTNRRIKPNYIDIINAQTPYLPGTYQQKEDTAYRDKVFDQNQQSLDISSKGLTQANEIALRNEALAQQGLYDQKKQLEEQKKQNKRAQTLGWANTGLSAGLGLAGLYQGSKSLADNIKPDLSGVVKTVMPSVTPDMFSEFSTGASSIAEGGVSDWWDFGGQGSTPSGGFLSDIGQGATDFATDIGTGLTDYIVDPIKKIGSSIWDAGDSFLDSIGSLFS